MQHELEVEMQIWEYLDRQCSEEDRKRIALLIEQDALWQSKYAEIGMLHNSLHKNLEPEHPGMRFSRNVMDAITQEKIAPATRTYLNKWVIRGIAVFFMMVAAGALIKIFSNTGISNSDSSLFSGLDLSRYRHLPVSGSVVLFGFLCLNIIVGLILLDTILKKKKMPADT